MTDTNLSTEVVNNHFHGVELRDYFAAKAMQAIISTVPHLSQVNPGDVAQEAYQFADAMLKEREK